MVTIVQGIDDSAIDLGELAKILKGACASGGTVKDRTIELQGDHKRRAAKVLERMDTRWRCDDDEHNAHALAV